MIPLPQRFAGRMRAELGAEADAFFAATEQPPARGMQINPHKAPDLPLDILVEGIQGAVPWAENGRYLELNSTAGAHPLHACGAYYIQEPSAMLPAALLNVQPGQAVLDLCAAPGGKSAQLAAMLNGQGTLVCNEVVPSRAEILSGNLERMGAQNTAVVSADPDRLARMWPQLFDAVLVDAPCSGEGMFRRHPETRLEWDADAPARCAARQAHILESASAMLKSGGRLCYSTCTFSREENEGVIGAFLSAHPEFRPVEFTVPVGEGRVLASQNGCLRLLPHVVRGEGHFAALLQKTETASQEPLPVSLLPPGRAFSAPDRQALDAFDALWRELSAAGPPEPNAQIGGLLVCAPPLPPLDGLKVYRAGLSLGRTKGKAFIPDHALALAAPPYTLRTVALDERDVLQYLAGEVLPAAAIPPGFWAVSFAGLPIGFVKHSDAQLKNHYPKGLRKR